MEIEKTSTLKNHNDDSCPSCQELFDEKNELFDPEEDTPYMNDFFWNFYQTLDEVNFRFCKLKKIQTATDEESKFNLRQHDDDKDKEFNIKYLFGYTDVMYTIFSNGYYFDSFRTIGKGFYSSVYKSYQTNATSIDDQYVSAIKIIPLWTRNTCGKSADFFAREIKMMRTFESANIIKFKDAFAANCRNHLCIVTEFCNGGTLAHKIKENKMDGLFFSERYVLQILAQISQAFIDVANHSKTMILLHRDLKPDNILFHNGVLKISDFGISEMVSAKNEIKKHSVSGGAIDSEYHAPEFKKRLYYSARCDVWSAGIIILELLTNKKLTTKDFKLIPFEVYSYEAISSELKDLLCRMFCSDAERIDWKDIVKHPVMKKVLPLEDKSMFLPNFLDMQKKSVDLLSPADYAKEVIEKRKYGYHVWYQ